jgi:hypothetical protein
MYAPSSRASFAGTDGWTTSASGTLAINVTGAKSFSASYGSVAYSVGFIVNAEPIA